jgi:hypothetical protein
MQNSVAKSAADFIALCAGAEIVRMNCRKGDGLAAQIVEIDYAAKTVRQWTTFRSGNTNGPFGPYPATITRYLE